MLAAAEGVVVEAVNGMAEQVPGIPPADIDPKDASGNYVVGDIGRGHHVLYAHLRRFTVPTNLAPGVRLRRGQRIGQVGNTGNSTRPHLHFQVMDSPLALAAVGLPFVFDRQVLQGRVIGTDREANETYDSGLPLTVESGTPTLVRNLMPFEGQVFSFFPE